MNKLLPVEIGKYKFNLSINREIALTVSDQYREFFAKMFSDTKGKSKKGDIEDVILNDGLKYIFERKDLLDEYLPQVTKTALPLMLNLAKDETDPEDLLEYIYKVNANEMFDNYIFELIMSSFTKGKPQPTVNVKFAKI